MHAAPRQHAHDLGLAHDLRVLTRRREALRYLLAAGAGFGALPLWGCGGGGSDVASASTGSDDGNGGDGTTDNGTCAVIPEETAGPYPADGSNTANGSIANMLALSGVVRSDLRSSFAGLSGTAAGVPLTVTLTLVDARSDCADLSGYAIYLWHCDRDGNYSLYSSAAADQNYLRGVQATDASGQATFTTIFPGCYSGRMPHIHFEIYRSVATTTSSTAKLRTSQLALPTDVCQAVYATSGYGASVTNLARISFATDNVFSDGVSQQLATMSGSVSEGYAAALTVAIAA